MFHVLDCFALMTPLHTWHSLNDLHEVITWTGVQEMGVAC